MTELYRADDGTIFEDEEDCLIYERTCELKDANIYFANSVGEQITVEEIITQTISIEDIAFIKCATYEDYEKMCNLFDEFGVVCPEDWDDKNTRDAQCWYWADGETYYDSGEWVNLRARINELERLKSIFEKVLNA